MLSFVANHASLLRDLGRFEAAAPHFKRALRGMAEPLSADPWAVGSTRSHRGACLTRMKRFDEAETELLAAYRILTENLGVEHTRSDIARHRLVELYRAPGQHDRAARFATHTGAVE